MILPQRLNPTKAWVVLLYAIPICGVWALAYVVPWWGWLLAFAAVLAAARKAGEFAAVLGGGGDGESRGMGKPAARSPEALPPLLALLLAPEKYVGVWAGLALCFASQTGLVTYQLLVSDRLEEVPQGTTTTTEWLFAGASITGGAAAGTMTVVAWVACCSVGFLAVMLALWSTLLAGSGRGAAARQAAKSAAAAQGLMMTEAAPPETGNRGGRRRQRGTGWGDPGVVVMCPREDVRVLVDGVAATLGPPEPRKLCQTCLVRKPMRSKVRP